MKDQRPTWFTAILWMVSPIILILTFRWLFFEPYVIPSGSMIPSLLVHDHIMVNKMKYGVRVPFSSEWMVQWDTPKRGQIVVFRYPDNPELFYVKRVIALPGEKVKVLDGVVHINGKPLNMEPKSEPPVEVALYDEGGFEYFIEDQHHLVRYFSLEDSQFAETEVPPHQVFVMGDNRDQSNDSRAWGPVPLDNLIGTPILIWLSCSETFDSARFLCNPGFMRWDRILKSTSDSR